MIQNIKGIGASKPRANVAASYQMPNHNRMGMESNADLQKNIGGQSTSYRHGQDVRIGSPLHEQMLATNLPKAFKPKSL
jgi:hypothetical protein